MYEDYFISTKKKQKKVKALYDKITLQVWKWKNDKLLETTIFAFLPLILLEVLYSRCCKQG